MVKKRSKSLGHKAPTGNRPTKGVTGITAYVPQAASNPQAVKTRRGVAHTNMPNHPDTPSGKGQKRNY